MRRSFGLRVERCGEELSVDVVCCVRGIVYLGGGFCAWIKRTLIRKVH